MLGKELHDNALVWHTELGCWGHGMGNAGCDKKVSKGSFFKKQF
jgi:hypothetical protein